MYSVRAMTAKLLLLSGFLALWADGHHTGEAYNKAVKAIEQRISRLAEKLGEYTRMFCKESC